MKNILVLFAMMVGVSSFAQAEKSDPIAYATPNKDTLYVAIEMFDTMSAVWNEPNYVAERPILIPVRSVADLKTSLGIKED